MNEELTKYIISLVVEGSGFAKTKQDLAAFTQQVERTQKTIEQYAKGTGEGKYQGRYPAGTPGGLGGQFVGTEQMRKLYRGEYEKLYSSKLSDIQRQFKEGQLTIPQYRKSLLELQQQFGKSVLDVNKLDQSHKNLMATYGKLALRAITVIPIWMALRLVYTSIISAVQNSFKIWAEYELAIAEIAMVSDKSTKELQGLGQVVVTLGEVYGTNMKDMLDAAKLFAQQGLSIEQTIEMTRTAAIGAQILGQSVKEVADNLTAAMRAYNISTGDSIDIVDKWMAVQKKFAVTAQDLGEATKTAAATAAAFGIPYAKFLGQITGIIEITRKSGSEAANALQMIYTRLFSTGKEAIQQIANVPVYINDTKDAVFETTNIYRDAGDVLDELAAKWKNLSESEKIQLAVSIGSRRQAAPFLALMSNYPRTIEAMVAAYNSAGEAARDFAIKQDTVSVKIKQMQSSWSNLTVALSQTGVWKVVIKSLDDVAAGLTKLINASQFYRQEAIKAHTLRLQEAETTVNELQNLEKLIELRDRYNLALSKARTPEERTFYTDILSQLTNVIPQGTQVGNIRGQLEEAIRKRLRAQVLLEKPEWGTVIDKYRRGAVTFEERQKTNKLVDEEVEKRYLLYNTEEKRLILEKQINEQTEKAFKTADQEEKLLQHRANLLRARGADEEQVLNYLIQEYETNQKLLAGDEERQKAIELRYQLEESIVNKIKEQGDVLKTSVSDNLKEVLLGTSDFSKAISNISQKTREQLAQQVAGGLTERLFDITGLGTSFGVLGVNLKDILSGKGALISGIEGAHSTVYKYIIQAHREGASLFGLASGGSAIAGWSSTGTGAPVVIGPGGVPITGTSGEMLPGYPNVNLGRLNILKKLPAKTQGAIGMAGKVGGSALLGYSQYQSAKSGGASQGLSIASGTLMGLGALGLMTGVGFGGVAAGAAAGVAAGGMGIMAGLAAIGPLGWAALGMMAIGMAMGMMGGKSKQTSIQESTSENRVASKIDISNRNLEIINRNLIALRTDIRQYILPQSAYFSENRGNITDQFSIMSRRGFQE